MELLIKRTDELMNNIINKETLIPISFALLFISPLFFVFTKFSTYDVEMAKMQAETSRLKLEVEKLEKNSIPSNELNLRLKQIELTLNDIKAKIK